MPSNLFKMQENKEKIKALKYKYSYYFDAIHEYGYTVIDVYCIENYIEDGVHFQIMIDEKLKMDVIKKLPENIKLNIKNNITGTFDIDVVEISKEWVDSCYSLYLKQNEISLELRRKLIEKPDVKSKYDLFDETNKEGLKKYAEKNYDEALKLFIEANKKNPECLKTIYNIACCHCKKNNNEVVYEYLNKLVEDGFSNWSYIIEDNDFVEIRNEKKFVEIIEKMIKKDSTMLYGSRNVTSYLLTHNLEETYRKYENKRYEKY